MYLRRHQYLLQRRHLSQSLRQLLLLRQRRSPLPHRCLSLRQFQYLRPHPHPYQYPNLLQYLHLHPLLCQQLPRQLLWPI